MTDRTLPPGSLAAETAWVHRLARRLVYGKRRAAPVAFADRGLLPTPSARRIPFGALAAGLACAALAAAVVVVVAWARRQPPVPGSVAPPASVAADADWSQQPGATARPSREGEPRSAAELAARVERYLQPLAAMGAFAGSVLVARGELVVTRAFGLADHAAQRPNTVDTRFKLMSLTKPIAATVLLRLVQAGDVALESRVADHLAGWPAAWADVTVHTLLDHTSGVPDLEAEWGAIARERGERGLAVWRTLAARLADRGAPARVAPRYGNFGYELAGCVAEAVAGVPFRELVAREVLRPGGMAATGLDDGAAAPHLATGYFFGAAAPQPSRQDMSVIQAAGGLWSTVGDLYRFDRALRDDTLLDARWRATSTTPREGASGYAIGWSTAPVHGRRCWQHGGGANGFVANLLRFPDDDACVIVLSNFAFAPITRLGADLAAVLFGLEHEIAAPLGDAQLDAAAGVFASAEPGGRRLLLRRAGRQLLAFDLWPGSTRVGGALLVPVAPGRFLAPWGDGAFEIDAARVVTPQGLLARTGDGAASWRALAGPLDLRPAVAAGAALRERAGAFWLELDGGWPARTEVVPCGDDVAMALFMAEGGTVLRRAGAALTWTRVDGTVVELTRRQ